ncbi:bestrophin-4-like [Physella acuta]|uniref:bestrophin-4-like n=1 Tax=Physella acuta TaxID=109671 RepID=UPI0027DDABB2|nr:bestrophin-4-like [Physella acuta]
MTIIYQNRVATTSLGGFLRLLIAWKGSVYKLLYKELVIFLVMYATISMIYRLALTESQQRTFETMAIECRSATSVIPLSFLLGFYVTFIVGRWWQQFHNVPWPDRTLFVMSTYLHGFDEKSRMMRRAVARYVLFGLILILRCTSVSVMKRFPTLDHVVEAGFVTKEEVEMYEKVQCRYIKFWVPIVWANHVLVTARKEGRIQTDFGLRMVIEYLADFRDKCSVCFVYDWITVPLVYTQVVTLAVYTYFAVALVGQQYLNPDKKYEGYEGDFYVPGFTIMQFLFYMGWLKVAEQMINPFGEDDDDYDFNWLLDRHTAVAFCLVDQCYGKHPGFIRDAFWDDENPDIPYTESSLSSVRPNFMGTTFNIQRPTLEEEKMIMSDHEDTQNQNDWSNGQRKRSITGSFLSLLQHRHSRAHGSHVTLNSFGSGLGRQTLMPNGHPGNETNNNNRRSSLDIPVRQRSNTESEIADPPKRGRKLSLPFGINLFTKPRTPVMPRFIVEPVKEADDVLELPPKPRRSGLVNIAPQNSDKVSRIPELSAIEEGNTVTSMAQLIKGGTIRRVVSTESTGFEGNEDSMTQPAREEHNTNVRDSRKPYTPLRERKEFKFEPLIVEADEEYETAYATSEPGTPVNHYFDAIDSMDGAKESFINKRKGGQSGGSNARR